MDANALRLFILVGAAVLLVGCATTPSNRPQPVQPPVTQTAPRSQAAPAPPATKQTPPPKAAATLPKASSPTQPSKQQTRKGEIPVTKKEYNKTFDEVHHLIQQLNAIIEARDYREWLNYLTPRYEATYSNPKTLTELSDQPMLKRYNLHLKSLKDYFLDVVVPSRANARLDDLDFVSKTQVKAITVIDGKRYILYDLRFEDGGWKIGVS